MAERIKSVEKREEIDRMTISPSLIAARQLLDDEIAQLCLTSFKELELPEPEGDVVYLVEKVFIPSKEYPGVNFVGRILGPRGLVIKLLAEKTGCKLHIRGKGSLRDALKELLYQNLPHFEHLKEELHVLISCEDTEARAKLKLENAVRQVNKLLIPPPVENGIDELKRKSLTQLAILNGTYRGEKNNAGWVNSPWMVPRTPIPSYAMVAVPVVPCAFHAVEPYQLQ